MAMGVYGDDVTNTATNSDSYVFLPLTIQLLW